MRHGVPIEELLVVAEDYDAADIYAGITRKLLSGAWPWRKHTETYDPEDGPQTAYYWIRTVKSEEDLDKLLLSADNDELHFIVTDESAEWTFRPYEGGNDILTRTAADKHTIAALHPDWLPPDWPQY